MKNLLIVFCLLILFSCGKERSVLLPEIQNARITEITDVSPAYLFYDETKPDSLDLNQNNLIISTNWLVNVYRRLTLKQVIPSIIKLQDKKRKSSHKKESARNYYTCNDNSIKNLGFIDFTDVVYDYVGGEIEPENYYNIVYRDKDVIWVFSTDGLEYKTNFKSFENQFLEIILKNKGNKTIKLSFNNKLSFQDYITFKWELSQFKLENTSISDEEYIFN